MSAREIIEQIPAMSDHELRLIAAAVRERLDRETPNAGNTPIAGRKLSHDEAMDHVFTEFAPVLAKLAQ